LITRAVVPAAGLGTRLLPVTRSVPKELLPVVDRPVVDYVIEELAAGGIEQVLLVTSPSKYAIEQHFEHDPADGGPIVSYVHQSRPAGLGDAVRHGAEFAGTMGAVVALGDAIIEPPSDGSPGIVRRLLEAYDRSGATAAVAVTEVAATDVSRYGIVVARGDGPVLTVSEIVEKPAPGSVPSRLAVAARYVIGPEVFAALRETGPDADGEVQLTTALQQVIEEGRPVVAVRLGPGERRHDIGTPEGYSLAFLEHALQHPALGPALRRRASDLLRDGPD
jgi:UTP--glucose-1-phosphate uridylyltransferase